MFARQQPLDSRLCQHGGEELAGDLAFKQPVAVFREARMIPHRIVDAGPEQSGRSLSEEIEYRLERSLAEEVLLYGIQDPMVFLNAVNTITIVLASLERQT